MIVNKSVPLSFSCVAGNSRTHLGAALFAMRTNHPEWNTSEAIGMIFPSLIVVHLFQPIWQRFHLRNETALKNLGKRKVTMGRS
jgi:hypothetical protein